MPDRMTTNALHWPAPGNQARGAIAGPAGALEIAVGVPKSTARGVVVVAHPHPQHGGTLDNKVTHMAARGLIESGFVAVRPNYRGVGQSEGAYDHGHGELEDLRAARHWALTLSDLPDGGLTGFSFGAWLALRLAVEDGARALVTIGLPAEYFDDALPRPDCAWRAIFGGQDDVIALDGTISAVSALTPAVDLQIMQGAGHFLHGRLTELRRLVGDHFNAHGS